jgi:hypothetical protein
VCNFLCSLFTFCKQNWYCSVQCFLMQWVSALPYSPLFGLRYILIKQLYLLLHSFTFFTLQAKWWQSDERRVSLHSLHFLLKVMIKKWLLRLCKSTMDIQSRTLHCFPMCSSPITYTHITLPSLCHHFASHHFASKVNKWKSEQGGMMIYRVILKYRVKTCCWIWSSVLHKLLVQNPQVSSDSYITNVI